MNTIGSPNSRYYDRDGKAIVVKGRAVGKFAKNMKLSSASNWFSGKDFVADVFVGADSYFTFTRAEIYDESIEKYHELRRHVAEYLYTIHTLKSKEEFLKELSLPTKKGTT